MTLFQVGPRPNAVSCLLDPTRLPPGQIHCQPRILVGDRSLRATGTPAILRDLMNARQQAQTSGIQVDGTIQGSTIAVRAVNFTRRVIAAVRAPRPADRPQAPLAIQRLRRMESSRARAEDEVLFETVIDGITIRLLAIAPSGGF